MIIQVVRIAVEELRSRHQVAFSQCTSAGVAARNIASSAEAASAHLADRQANPNAEKYTPSCFAIVEHIRAPQFFSKQVY